ncbi:WecB/TagA/CpsF family glycosyltransferase, partial [Spirulina sp. 06S082]|uniref:WecB/TagA/CpsF family glycosyltransferase n=1 Tax=Spirulina sp. 06S082 TaxID=3110248 RepID=UPI002B1F9589
DGQPVRWALNWLHGVQLADRVYGPKLMMEICNRASQDRLQVYLYGAQSGTLSRLAEALPDAVPGLEIAGAEPSRFRQLSTDERSAMIERIRDSGAAIAFVGLGCPRQETFAYECATDLSMPVVAVGAAFDYHAGVRSEPSPRLQRLGLQWAYRLAQDPRRLWKRYLGLNTLFVGLVLLQRLRIWQPRGDGTEVPTRSLKHG